MELKDLVHMDSVINACNNESGNMEGIPVFERIQYYEGEFYGNLIGYQDMFGDPVDQEIVKQIEKRMIVH